MSIIYRESAHLESDVRGFMDRALDEIQKYSWPGNISLLPNTIEWAVILEDDNFIGNGTLSLVKEKGVKAEQMKASTEVTSSPPGQEKDRILNALDKCLWVQNNAADKLGISPRVLHYKVKKFGVTPPNWRKHR